MILSKKKTGRIQSFKHVFSSKELWHAAGELDTHRMILSSFPLIFKKNI